MTMDETFQHYSLTIYEHARELTVMYQTDDETLANGLLHALAMHLSQSGENAAVEAKHFAAALERLVPRYANAVTAIGSQLALPLQASTS